MYIDHIENYQTAKFRIPIELRLTEKESFIKVREFNVKILSLDYSRSKLT